ncbi:unnamed protein product [Sphenostylis stenocarpa]|uniref:Uncharacterized protein n=1 Tax=Sphenostylis stenocarpa TaxID=92480 RepID=A0AA86SJV1_9FABA|nr:unnamed protein product [Sphenostylis stenocarpa]
MVIPCPDDTNSPSKAIDKPEATHGTLSNGKAPNLKNKEKSKSKTDNLHNIIFLDNIDE